MEIYAIMRLLSGVEVSCLENYVKVVLYAYPILKNVGQDYQQHIQNKALLSYKSEALAERLVEYIAEEIINKRKSRPGTPQWSRG